MLAFVVHVVCESLCICVCLCVQHICVCMCVSMFEYMFVFVCVPAWVHMNMCVYAEDQRMLYMCVLTGAGV